MDFKLQVTINGKGKIVNLEEFKEILGIKEKPKQIRKPKKVADKKVGE